MNPQLHETLLLINQHFTAAKINWAIGGSLLLKAYGLVEISNDIDLIVAVEDIEKADSILSFQAIKKETQPNKSIFETSAFYQYERLGINIDVMGDFAIRHAEGVFVFPFNQDTPTNPLSCQADLFPYNFLEDWYVLYQLLKRDQKVQLLEHHFKKQGLEQPCLLQSYLTTNLPVSIKDRIKMILEFSNS